MEPKTLKEFSDGINAYLRAHPKHAGLPVITASDDEGNRFNKVYYGPEHGKWEVYTDEVEGVCVS